MSVVGAVGHNLHLPTNRPCRRLSRTELFIVRSCMDGSDLTVCIGRQLEPLPAIDDAGDHAVGLCGISFFFLFQLYSSVALGSFSFSFLLSAHRLGELASCDARSNFTYAR